jgi:uncharacterized membrane protein
MGIGTFIGRAGPLVAGGYNTGVSVLAIVLRFTIWVLIVLAAVWVIREIIATIRRGQSRTPRAVSPALMELDVLYARGEVSRIDYLTRRADLSGVPPPIAPPPG